jgi:hypothetical protein
VLVSLLGYNGLATSGEGKRAISDDDPGAGPYVGELYLADISVPPALYAWPSIGIEAGPLFAGEDVIRIETTGTGE